MNKASEPSLLKSNSSEGLVVDLSTLLCFCPPPQPAAREGRRAARVAVEALQQAGLLQPVPQHADRPGEAGPLLLL